MINELLKFDDMIYGFIGMSLLFVAIGLALTVNNAKYLLSGYNTMSEEDRKKVDIKKYVPFFRNFHIFLGVSFFIIGMALTYLISESVGGIFLSIYPILCYIYFLIAGGKYWKGFSTKGSSWVVIILVGVLVFVGVLLGYGMKEDKVMLEPQALVFQGSYGETLSSSHIQSIELVGQLPQITFKTNGFGLGSVRKGYFRTKEKEVVKLLLNGDQKPIILITKTDGKKIYYSARSASNEDIVEEIQQNFPDKVHTR